MINLWKQLLLLFYLDFLALGESQFENSIKLNQQNKERESSLLLHSSVVEDNNTNIISSQQRFCAINSLLSPLPSPKEQPNLGFFIEKENQLSPVKKTDLSYLVNNILKLF